MGEITELFNGVIPDNVDSEDNIVNILTMQTAEGEKSCYTSEIEGGFINEWFTGNDLVLTQHHKTLRGALQSVMESIE